MNLQTSSNDGIWLPIGNEDGNVQKLAINIQNMMAMNNKRLLKITYKKLETAYSVTKRKYLEDDLSSKFVLED